ncbi:sugar phosphate isomerase/epimerase family protein [Allorhodopirellula heiligendammensis]|uniref:Xylose isomerase-like TIM barrel n=1 Tax=Allorhodopirellula heiligendammensis TaxID=2714739 RepID=A0A5C6BFQ9_9BACT|nr:sugar phosphate isomerase/epimerase family protein [Allorhodopirellula heiligendammensis]TWU10119.1 Xylose isomerase-like TIM barrel [Allorhodopirellula heiligendammensis]|tara:strand:- start:324 stop:1259 length:936 start_codon:yes stop_codon:yes gene_type:complete
MHTLPRRHFLQTLAATAAVTGLSAKSALAHDGEHEHAPFKISLAEWSLHKALRSSESGISNLDFPRIAKEEFGIDGVEYVNQFFKDKARDQKYLTDLKSRCDDHGVTSVLIMVDGEGQIGDPDQAKRKKSVENHHQWVDAAKFLGCHSIRVNAASGGSYSEQLDYAADGLRQLSEYAAQQDINVLVENHGGLSSNAAWLAVVMERVGMDNCGTLPDFGNFHIRRGKDPESFDRYLGVQALMPYAKAVSAKTYDFNEAGDETSIDYFKIMKIVTDFGYHGYVGIEYEGGRLDEYAGIRATKALLERVRKELA